MIYREKFLSRSLTSRVHIIMYLLYHTALNNVRDSTNIIAHNGLQRYATKSLFVRRTTVMIYYFDTIFLLVIPVIFIVFRITIILLSSIYYNFSSPRFRHLQSTAVNCSQPLNHVVTSKP